MLHAQPIEQRNGLFLKRAGAVELGRFEEVNQVMRSGVALSSRGLGGADGHAAVDLAGVCVDNLGAETLGKGDGEFRLS